jgi:hypothetical protein
MTCGLVWWTFNANGQAGPPFRSDEPDTPGNAHWEINIAGVAARNPAEGGYAVPNLDFNYGLGDRIQLKYEMAYGIEERGSTPSLAGGVGNSLAGVKYRFFEKRASKSGESDFTLSIYPQLLFSGIFVGDDWRVRRNLTPNVGPRYVWKTNPHNSKDVAPRFGLAWAPGGSRVGSTPKAVIRAGFSMFYRRFDIRSPDCETLERRCAAAILSRESRFLSCDCLDFRYAELTLATTSRAKLSAWPS